jgi:hypothetical protein
MVSFRLEEAKQAAGDLRRRQAIGKIVVHAP